MQNIKSWKKSLRRDLGLKIRLAHPRHNLGAQTMQNDSDGCGRRFGKFFFSFKKYEEIDREATREKKIE